MVSDFNFSTVDALVVLQSRGNNPSVHPLTITTTTLDSIMLPKPSKAKAKVQCPLTWTTFEKEAYLHVYA